MFPAQGQVELLPSDSHYYTRFARLQLHAFPRYQAFDPYVSFPEGAQVNLPPLHAWMVTAAVAMAGEPRAELGAAWVGPALSALWLGALLWLSWGLLGAPSALALTALLGLTPALVDAGALGNADHHLHEGFLAAAIPLAMMALIRSPSLRTAALAGALLGTGRLLTPSAFMFVPCAALAAALAAWWRPEDQGYARALAWTGLLAAAIGAGGAVAFGSPRSLEYQQLTAFHPLLALACFGGAYGVALWLALRRRAAAAAARVPLGTSAGRPSSVKDAPRVRPWRKLVKVVPFAAWLGAAAIAVALLQPMRQALSHLGRADPLLALVTESEPLWRDPRWAVQLLGVLLLLLPLGLFLAVRHIRKDDIPLLAPFCTVVPLLAATALQARFAPALAGSAALLLAECFTLVPAARLRRLAAAVGALPLALSLVPPPRQPPPPDIRLVRPTLLWMREHLPPASADPYDGRKAEYGVVASYLLGHTLPLWAERPSVATLFSQLRVHVEGNRRAADVLAAADDEDAYRLAVEAGARYVLVTPSERIVGHPDADLAATALGRLLEDAWMASPESTTGHFRLVHDSAEQRLRPQGGSYARLFEVVAGATLRGNAVRAVGPEVAGHRYSPARRGKALRVSYPGRYRVTCAGGAAGTADVSEAAVRKGAAVPVQGCGE
ncbi:MAG TPA: peptide transporter [Myxococcales bacterium]|nr:peptide transporter [Myxococcales bacterium]